MRVINYPDAYLVLELTNQCPLACTHCIQGRRGEYEHFRAAGFMDQALVRRLLKDLESNGIRFNDLILFWLGEPLMHPQFASIYSDVLEAARAARLFSTVTIHTNAVRLTREIARLAAGNADVRQQWHFSLDAATYDTYRLIKGRDLFRTAVENVEAMVSERAEAGARYPRFCFQFIVRRENRAEARAFAAYWRGSLEGRGLACEIAGPHVPPGDRDCVFFRQLDCLDAADQASADAVYREVLAEHGLFIPGAGEGDAGSVAQLPAESVPQAVPCSGFFKSPTVNWDGRVTVCTRDSALRLAVGDISNEPFSRVWWGNPRLDAIRLAVVGGEYAALDFCRECMIPMSYNYTGISAEELAVYRRR